MVLKNVPIKICPNWAKGGRGKLNWDNVLKSASVFFDGIPNLKMWQYFFDLGPV